SLERGRINGAWKMNLAIMDYATGLIDNLDVFSGADNMNPHYDKDGDILFVSDRDGFRNLYRYDTDGKKVYQLTDLKTGITGITPYAPAITVAEDRDRILYTYLSNGKYTIYGAKLADFRSQAVSSTSVDHAPAALPPFAPGKRDLVNTGLRLMDNNQPKVAASSPTQSVPYKGKFGLEYIGGSAGVGVMTGNRSFGNQGGGAMGGVDMLFGDVLGNNQVYLGAALNGEFQDAAVQSSYINRKKPIGWGIGAAHLPFITGGGRLPFGDSTDIGVINGNIPVAADTVVLQRQFLQQINAFAFYPFSVTKRVEFGASSEFYSLRETNYVDYYGYDALTNSLTTRTPIASETVRGPKFGPVGIYSINAAFVGDNSYFGLTAPLEGWRYRISAERYFGSLWNFNGVLADGRRYFRVKPFTLAVRGLSYTRFGGNENQFNADRQSYQVQPFFIVQPWFVRGYPYKFLVNEAPD
ncbi:MAG TPA: hypothetical protein PK971_15585, partial [Saprospiraceae bacterium]|nr:hypothetical protein [Saprospiraceae bacterium]